MATIIIPVESLPTDLRNKTPDELINLIKLGHNLSYNNTSYNPTSLHTNQVAAVIGQIGEQKIREIYESKYIIDDVSKQGRKGDIILRRPSTPEHPIQHQILTEVKNYSTTIGTSEVDKFYRDLAANSAIVGGIFISINTKIVGISNDFHFTHRGDTPIVFISLRNLNESAATSITLLAADLLWAFIDSRHLVDDRIFQKLSKKITKLSDSINSLSLSRTHVNETRQIMDKQLNKIYESILITEMQMHTIITTINKTIGGSVEQSGEQLQILEKMDYTVLDNLINNNFDTSFYNTNKLHKATVHKIFDEYFNTFSHNGILLDLVTTKKSITIKYDKNLISLSFLKSRTDICFHLSKSPTTLEIPGTALFADNSVTFQLDKTLSTSGIFEDIQNCIDNLSDSALIGGPI